jgi:small conductance mechanosensitive channel
MDPEISKLVENLQVMAIDYGLDLLGAIVILVVGWIVAGWIQKAASKGLSRIPRADPTVTKALSGLTRYLVLILVVIAVLAQFGVQTASILAVLGTAGLAVGLALQGTLSNIAAGFMLLMLRPFKIGDYVDAEGVSGTVEGIGLFATELTTFDGIYLVVPNSQIWTRSILNYSRLPTRRMEVPIGIAYGDDIDKARAVLMELLEGDERVLKDPAPQVLVKELADSSINLGLRCWAKTDDFWNLMFDLNKLAKDRVEAAGCSIPFPQRDLHLIGQEPPAPATAG